MNLWLKVPIVIISLIAAVASSPEPVHAQSNGPCMDSTSSISRFYRNSYEGIATRSDANSLAWRTSQGIPTLTASQVKLVADTTACRAASTAFDSRVDGASAAMPVVVIELGTKRIVIKDLGRGGRLLNLLFNSDFTTFFKYLSL